MNDLRETALAKLRQAANGTDDAPVTLTANECRLILGEIYVWQSTAAITTHPSFHDRVRRYRKTGKL